MIVLAIIIVFAYQCREEGFTTIQEKTRALLAWDRAHPNASYAEFIRENPESNQVEYIKLRSSTPSTLADSLKI